jgi:hypothetical protein
VHGSTILISEVKLVVAKRIPNLVNIVNCLS